MTGTEAIDIMTFVVLLLSLLATIIFGIINIFKKK